MRQSRAIYQTNVPGLIYQYPYWRKAESDGLCMKCEAPADSGYHPDKCKLCWLRVKYDGMLGRCATGRATSYARKGIEVRITWAQFRGWALAAYPSGMDMPSIDWIDSDGHYEIGNMQWLETSQNCRGDLNKHLPKSLQCCPYCLEVKPVEDFKVARKHPPKRPVGIDPLYYKAAHCSECREEQENDRLAERWNREHQG